jgi:hypothetical protein
MYRLNADQTRAEHTSRQDLRGRERLTGKRTHAHTQTHALRRADAQAGYHRPPAPPRENRQPPRTSAARTDARAGALAFHSTHPRPRTRSRPFASAPRPAARSRSTRRLCGLCGRANARTHAKAQRPQRRKAQSKWLRPRALRATPRPLRACKGPMYVRAARPAESEQREK